MLNKRKVYLDLNRFFVSGIGLSENDERVLDKSKWKGQNLLGIALMRVREELKNARK